MSQQSHGEDDGNGDGDIGGEITYSATSSSYEEEKRRRGRGVGAVYALQPQKMGEDLCTGIGPITTDSHHFDATMANGLLQNA